MSIRGILYSSKKPVECRFDDGKIVGIESTPLPSPIRPTYIGPGFVDLQVNGFGGLDYNEIVKDPVGLARITHGLYAEGTTTHFPTVITNRPDLIKQLIRQIVHAQREDPMMSAGIGGIHLEGPFISPVDGPRGAHPAEFVLKPNIALFQQWQEAAEGSIRLITVSPEWETANVFIEYCRQQGIVVAIGHTNATHQQILDAVRAGASLSTHLGNGMHPVLARHPNYLWSQLANDELSATIIADGHHLPTEVIRVFQKVKKEKLVLISDCVSLAQQPAGDYTLHIGGEVTLSSIGRLHMRNDPSMLAGSVVSLKDCVWHLMHTKLATLEEAWDMASLRPFKLIHPDIPFFQNGADGDVILARQSGNDRLVIEKTFKKGVLVHAAH